MAAPSKPKAAAVAPAAAKAAVAPAKAAANNTAIGQTQALIAAAQTAKNMGSPEAAALQAAAIAASKNVTSSGAKGAIAQALGALEGTKQYNQTPAQALTTNAAIPTSQAQRTALNNQAIAASQALIAATQNAINSGNIELANQLKAQAQAAVGNVQSAGAKSAIQTAFDFLKIPEKPVDIGGTTTDTTQTDTYVDTPFFPSYTPSASIPKQTLAPGRDVINFQIEPVSAEAVEQVLFEQISGYELINLVRRDTVEGQNPFYTLISNLSSIRRQLDPAQIISLQQPNRTGFEIYEISLDERIPGDEYLQNNNISNFFYIADNGDLIVELDNMKDDEEVEIQMANSGKIT